MVIVQLPTTSYTFPRLKPQKSLVIIPYYQFSIDLYIIFTFYVPSALQIMGFPHPSHCVLAPT